MSNPTKTSYPSVRSLLKSARSPLIFSLRALLISTLILFLCADGLSFLEGLLLLLALQTDASPSWPKTILEYVRVIRKLPLPQGDIFGDVPVRDFDLAQNRERFALTRAVFVIWGGRVFFYALFLLTFQIAATESPVIYSLLLFPWLLLNTENDSELAGLLVFWCKLRSLLNR